MAGPRGRWLRRIGVLAILSMGCDGGPPLSDAGSQPDAASGDAGGGPVDEIAPRVTSTRPRNGEDLVARTAELEIRFSEAIRSDSGVVSATSAGLAIVLGEGVWVPEGDVLRIAAEELWPGGARVDVRVEGFEDLAGNAQVAVHELVFHTSDEGPPTVVESTPAEGATDVPVELAQLTIRFSEPMSAVLGGLSLEGGAGELGAPEWSSETELRVSVSGLEAGASYRVVLDGFEDRSGNLLDGTPVVGDGAIDFTTAPDVTAPTVVDSNPTNGQLDLDVAALREIVVTFSEPMDAGARTAVLSDGADTLTLTGNWSGGGTVLTFLAIGRLSVDAEHRLDLSALRDAAGNALDGTVNLTDGELVFTTTAADEALPFVVFSTPTEGAVDVSTRTAAITLTFSEAIDSAMTDLLLASATDSRTLTGVWNAAGTRLTAALGAGLAAETDYTVDLRAFEDTSGNRIDAAHPYLVDGVLSFRTGRATGENCADPLTTADALVDGGAYEWELPGGAFRTADGTFSCGSGNFVSGVIAFEKTSADLAGGGRALRITTTNNDALDGMSLEIFRDVCDRSAPAGGDAAREVCVGQRPYWTQYLDLPAGTYYLWIHTGSTAEFAGGTLRIEEVSAIPQGESCDVPYDTSSPNYSAPAADEHAWLIEHGAFQSVEYGDATSGDETFPCATRQGPDGVIRVPKARTSSILDVEVDPFPAQTGTDIFDHAGVIAEVLSACTPHAPATQSLACPGRINRPEAFQVRGEPGDYWLWLAANNTEVDNVRTTIRVREIDPGPGETCETAIAIAPASSVAITPSSTERFFAPSCMPSGADVTWYRYTTTQELSLVAVEGTGPLALVSPSDGREIGCVDQGSLIGIPRRAPVGTEVCVAVPSGAGITGLSIRETGWQGVHGTAIDLAIARPVDGAGAGIAITSEAWLAVTPTQLYMGISPNGTSTAAIVAAPRSGAATADRILLDRFTMGNAAVTFGEALFSVEETSRPLRLHRLIDPTGSIGATVWDTGTTYDAQDIDSLAPIGASTELAMVSDTPNRTADPRVTVFYRSDSSAPVPTTRVGESTSLDSVVAIAATSEWIFLMGTGLEGAASSGRTIYRVPWSDVTATPEPLAHPELLSLSTANGSMVYDAGRDILYFRQGRSPAGVHAVFGAASATPFYAGAVVARGSSSDHGLALDPTIPALFLFETETVSTGAFARVE